MSTEQREIEQLKMELAIAREEKRAAIGRLLMLEMQIGNLLMRKSKIPMAEPTKDMCTTKITPYDIGYEHAIRDVLELFREKEK